MFEKKLDVLGGCSGTPVETGGYKMLDVIGWDSWMRSNYWNLTLIFVVNTKRNRKHIYHLETTDFNRWVSATHPSHQPSF